MSQGPLADRCGMAQRCPSNTVDELLPLPLRLPIAVTAVLCAATVLILGLSVAGTSAPSNVDTWVGSGVHSLLADVPNLSPAVVQAGDPGPIIVMAALLAALCGLLRRPYHALLSVTAPATVGVATTLLKPAIGRTFEGFPAFPSGHTAAVTALSVVAGLLIVSMTHAQLAVGASMATAIVLLVGAAIGLAVVAANWHYPTDALGGFCTAVALVVALAFLLDGLRFMLYRPGERSTG
ncbi:MAG: phosphatase PAP2 family protein [Pseudonocardiaceae bacterium]